MRSILGVGVRVAAVIAVSDLPMYEFDQCQFFIFGITMNVH